MHRRRARELIDGFVAPGLLPSDLGDTSSLRKNWKERLTSPIAYSPSHTHFRSLNISWTRPRSTEDGTPEAAGFGTHWRCQQRVLASISCLPHLQELMNSLVCRNKKGSLQSAPAVGFFLGLCETLLTESLHYSSQTQSSHMVLTLQRFIPSFCCVLFVWAFSTPPPERPQGPSFSPATARSSCAAPGGHSCTEVLRFQCANLQQALGRDACVWSPRKVQTDGAKRYQLSRTNHNLC